MQVWSLAQHSGLKDPALPQLRRRSQLQLGSDPWPGNSICYEVAKKKKKKILLNSFLSHFLTCAPLPTPSSFVLKHHWCFCHRVAVESSKNAPSAPTCGSQREKCTVKCSLCLFIVHQSLILFISFINCFYSLACSLSFWFRIFSEFQGLVLRFKRYLLQISSPFQ